MKEDDPPLIIRGVKRVTLQDLISQGLINPKQRLFKTYKDNRYEAEIMAGGQLRLLHDNTVWNSLSGASDHITDISTDGWEWWYTEVNGQRCVMDDLRKRLASN
jgi:hypothetical protein